MLYCHGEKDSLLHNDQTNKTYFLVYSPLNWTSAFDYCRNNYNGGYFSWIRKPADRDYVLNMLPKEVANSSKDVWIGYVLLHSNLLKGKDISNVISGYQRHQRYLTWIIRKYKVNKNKTTHTHDKLDIV